jgi:hypothetical protein
MVRCSDQWWTHRAPADELEQRLNGLLTAISGCGNIVPGLDDGALTHQAIDAAALAFPKGAFRRHANPGDATAGVSRSSHSPAGVALNISAMPLFPQGGYLLAPYLIQTFLSSMRRDDLPGA